MRGQSEFSSDSIVSCRTVWSGIFHYRRASEAWLAAAGPSRCSAAPRGWALRLPAHTSGNTRRDRQQSSALWLTGGVGISCWPPATVVLCQVYVQAQALAAFTGAKPFMAVKLPLGGSRPFILRVQGWSHVWQGKQRRSGIFSLGHVQEGGKILILSQSDSS